MQKLTLLMELLLLNNSNEYEIRYHSLFAVSKIGKLFENVLNWEAKTGWNVEAGSLEDFLMTLRIDWNYSDFPAGIFICSIEP